MSKLSKHHFWEWFTRNNREYLALRTKSKKEQAYWVNELNAHLRSYFKFLGFSLEWQSQKAKLTVSVNGKVGHFKKVDDLVAKAPKIPGWSIVALEDPHPIDFLLEQQIQDTGIDPRDLSFTFDSNDPYNATLIVFHPLCTLKNKHLIYHLASGAIYNLLGERSFGIDIDSMQVANLSEADPNDVQELEALPGSIGLRKSAIAVDSNGLLVNMH